jgi:hypothetical protein
MPGDGMAAQEAKTVSTPAGDPVPLWFGRGKKSCFGGDCGKKSAKLRVSKVMEEKVGDHGIQRRALLKPSR